MCKLATSFVALFFWRQHRTIFAGVRRPLRIPSIFDTHGIQFFSFDNQGPCIYRVQVPRGTTEHYGGNHEAPRGTTRQHEVPRCTTTYYEVLRCITRYYSEALRRSTTYYDVLRVSTRQRNVLRDTTMYCEVLRRTELYEGAL